ncbi:MAG TPA: lysophospholipid acyltransferase family protein [Candidatus Didemnitutus sp.]|nr:lysophospholipid acyltransferase family protein [Candidatus Didemnitutus sp.]
MFLHFVYNTVGYYLSLFFFGAFGLELNVVCLLTALLPATERIQRMHQRLIHWHFALFHWWCGIAWLIRVRYRGFDRLPKNGCVLVANHPALIDITCLLARIPEAVCIFKPAIRRNPLLGAGARRAGYLASDGGHDLVRRAAERVAAGSTLVIFPEGTRTPPGETLLPLKPGFVLIAQLARAPIQLVRITTDSNLLVKGRAWWRTPRLPAHVEVSAGPLITTEGGESAEELTARIEQWFRSPGTDNAACATAERRLS